MSREYGAATSSTKRWKSPCASSSARSEIVRTTANGRAKSWQTCATARAFHLDGQRVGQQRAQLVALGVRRDEAVAADDQPVVDRPRRPRAHRPRPPHGWPARDARGPRGVGIEAGTAGQRNLPAREQRLGVHVVLQQTWSRRRCRPRARRRPGRRRRRSAAARPRRTRRAGRRRWWPRPPCRCRSARGSTSWPSRRPRWKSRPARRSVRRPSRQGSRATISSCIAPTMARRVIREPACWHSGLHAGRSYSVAPSCLRKRAADSSPCALRSCSTKSSATAWMPARSEQPSILRISR